MSRIEPPPPASRCHSLTGLIMTWPPMSMPSPPAVFMKIVASASVTKRASCHCPDPQEYRSLPVSFSAELRLFYTAGASWPCAGCHVCLLSEKTARRSIPARPGRREAALRIHVQHSPPGNNSTVGRVSLGPAHGSPDSFDDHAVAFNDQLQGVTLVKHAVAGFERNPSASLRGVRLTALGDAHTVVDHEGVSTVGFD